MNNTRTDAVRRRAIVEKDDATPRIAKPIVRLNLTLKPPLKDATYLVQTANGAYYEGHRDKACVLRTEGTGKITHIDSGHRRRAETNGGELA